jgi:hypothetical protein
MRGGKAQRLRDVILSGGKAGARDLTSADASMLWTGTYELHTAP